MPRVLAPAAVMLLAFGAAHAQGLTSALTMGATSSFGLPGGGGSSGADIPLGATELNTGGLRPMPSAACAAGTGMVGTAHSYGATSGAVSESGC